MLVKFIGASVDTTRDCSKLGHSLHIATGGSLSEVTAKPPTISLQVVITRQARSSRAISLCIHNIHNLELTCTHNFPMFRSFTKNSIDQYILLWTSHLQNMLQNKLFSFKQPLHLGDSLLVVKAPWCEWIFQHSSLIELYSSHRL